MTALKRKAKKNIAHLLLVLTFLVFGHTFFASAQYVAADSVDTFPVVHHDSASHQNDDDHVTCPSDLHQFLHSKCQNSAPNTFAVTFAVQESVNVSFLQLSEYFRSNTDVGIPPDLPLALKTQLLF